MEDTRVIHISDADLATSISDAAEAGEPLRVEVEGEIFVLHVVRVDADDGGGVWSGYDLDKVRDAIDRYAGSWSDLDVDRMIADLYKAREEGSRPADRPGAIW